jgi:hypothetical protein
MHAWPSFDKLSKGEGGIRGGISNPASNLQPHGELVEPWMVCAAHLPSPSAGRFVRWKDAFDFKPA